MKKLTAFLLACVLLITVAFAAPIMPRSGYYNGNVSVSSGRTWTSGRYKIPSTVSNVYLDASVTEGGDVKVELYGASSTSGSGTKVGTINTATGSSLSVSRNYAYYYFKVVNSSGEKSTVYVMLST